jgi:hypothetical protein
MKNTSIFSSEGKLCAEFLILHIFATSLDFIRKTVACICQWMVLVKGQ